MGFYERLVGVVKRSHRKAIGKVCLTNEQLLTFIKEAEAVSNSRPLVYVDEDINSKFTLTSSPFLTNPKLDYPFIQKMIMMMMNTLQRYPQLKDS